MNLLPLELIYLILEYDGRIKYRNGKYMNQIAPDDDRYKMLFLTMPKIRLFYHNFYYMTISDSRNKNINVIYCEKHMKFELGEEVSLIYTYSNTRYVRYIYNNQGFQYRLTIYKPPKPTFIESVIVYLYDLCRKFI